MPKERSINGTKFLKIRVSKNFYDFIKMKTREIGIPSVSEFCRSALEIVCMGLYLKKNVRLGDIENEFWKRYKR